MVDVRMEDSNRGKTPKMTKNREISTYTDDRNSSSKLSNRNCTTDELTH